MKKFSIILSLSFVWLISSCESDKAEMNYVQKNDLAGQWEMAQTGTSNTANGIDYVPYQGDAECGTDVDNVVFNEDMSYSNTDFHGNGVGCEHETTSGTYTLSGHNLTLTTVDDAGVSHSSLFLITKLTYTNLEVNYTDGNGKLVWVQFNKK